MSKILAEHENEIVTFEFTNASAVTIAHGGSDLIRLSNSSFVAADYELLGLEYYLANHNNTDWLISQIDTVSHVIRIRNYGTTDMTFNANIVKMRCRYMKK